VFSLVGGLQEIADERRCLPASSAGFSGIGRQLLHHTMPKAFTYLRTYLFTCSEANRFSAIQEIPPHFMEPEGTLTWKKI